MNSHINISDLFTDIVAHIQLGLHIYHLEDLDDDGSFRMIYANNASELHTQIPSDELMGKTLDECFHGLREKGIPQQYAAVVRSQKANEIGELFYGENKVDGSWFNIHAFPLPHNCVGVSFENITEKKKTEDILKESYRELERKEILLQSIFTSAPIGINLAIDRNFHWVNQRFTDITGYSKKELIGKSAQMLYPSAEEFERVGDAIYNSIKKHGTGSIDTQWQRKDGSIIDVYLSATTVNLDYLPDGVTFSVLDISDRKSLEKALFKSKEEWEATFNSMEEVVTIHDTNMRLVRANKAAYDFFEKHNEIVGKRCCDLFHGLPERCQGCPEILTMHDGESHSALIEHNVLGKVFYVSSSPIFDKNNEVQFLVHVAKDVTEQKRLEDQLLQSQKMEAIGTLAGGIAHDFNNILSAILGFSQLAERKMAKGGVPQKEVKAVVEAAKRASELVKQILTISRRADHHLQPLNPSVIVKEALRMLRSSLPTTVVIKQEIDSQCGTILADPTQIHQIVVNLCTNAMHAMEKEKGTLTVRLFAKEVGTGEIPEEDGLTPGRFVVLSVIDTGHGMDKATVDRIFEPYYTTKAAGKGTGLGLAVIHGIVKEHNGFVKVLSDFDMGTTFDVHIPTLISDTTALEGKEEIALLPTGTEHILLVDDEESIIEIVKSALEQLGYQVTTTTDSVDALNKVSSRPDLFDLIITDQTMPALTGEELAQDVLKIKPDMPIILCTGYSSVIVEEELLVKGIRRYLLKPIDITRLAKTVRIVLDEE